MISFETYLSETEKVLTKSLKRIVIRGKEIEEFQFFFTQKNCEYARLLASTQKNTVSQQNVYFFATINSKSCLQRANIIRKMAIKCKI